MTEPRRPDPRQWRIAATWEMGPAQADPHMQEVLKDLRLEQDMKRMADDLLAMNKWLSA